MARGELVMSYTTVFPDNSLPEQIAKYIVDALCDFGTGRLDVAVSEPERFTGARTYFLDVTEETWRPMRNELGEIIAYLRDE
jgi:hypothetical protein